MPLWAAAALFVSCIIGTVLSFRAYFTRRRRVFFVMGIVLSLLCSGAVVYLAAAFLLVSAVK